MNLSPDNSNLSAAHLNLLAATTHQNAERDAAINHERAMKGQKALRLNSFDRAFAAEVLGL